MYHINGLKEESHNIFADTEKAFKHLCVCIYLSVECVCVCEYEQLVGIFFLFTMWVLGLKLRSLGLATSTEPSHLPRKGF